MMFRTFSSTSSSRGYLFFLFLAISAVTSKGSIGVCNGRLGDNLPTEKQVVELYKTNGIKRMRIYEPNQATLRALSGTDIELALDVPNDSLQALQSESDATLWVQTNIRPHFPATRIRYIVLGNEIDPSKPAHSRYLPLVLPAMQNTYAALSRFGLQDQIKISTATYSALLDNTSPPSNSIFKNTSFVGPIVRFLVQTRAPLLANIYPYFAYIGDTDNIGLPFALFTAPGVVVQDGQYGYQNLFDAMVDGVHYALEKVGGRGVEVVVSESGWPSDGGVGATMDNASTYYRNLIGHVKRGTPRNRSKEIETYLFAMFDENQKPGERSEQHFGLFYPNQERKYEVSFNNE